MRDLIAVCYGVPEEKKPKAIMAELIKEIEKGTDLSPYLTLSYLVQERAYRVVLTIPTEADIVDSLSGDTE